MEATTMSREIERERESTRPERENPTLSVPAFRKVTCARPPRARDLTGRGSGFSFSMVGMVSWVQNTEYRTDRQTE